MSLLNMYILRSKTKFRQTKHLKWILDDIKNLTEPYTITTVVMNQYGDAITAQGDSIESFKLDIKRVRKMLPKYK